MDQRESKNITVFPTDDAEMKLDEINLLIDHCEVNKNKISDGYHTFGELYDHRVTLFVALCRLISHTPAYQNNFPVWRSLLHSDGSSMEGWFVMGIYREEGKQITYHLPITCWIDTWFADTLIKSPAFDGHTAADVLTRINQLI